MVKSGKFESIYSNIKHITIFMNKEEVFQFLCSADDKSGYLKKEIGFKKNFPELYAELITWKFPENFTFQQKLYHYLADDSDLKLGLCPVCGNRCKFGFFQVGYRVYCSLKCSASSKITRNKYKNTCQKRYGVEHYAQTKECQEKMRQTTKERYGVYNYTQTNEYKEKSKKTCQKKYNVNNYTQTQEYKEKVKQICEEKYGVYNYAQTKECREKMRQTCLEKYGVESFSQTNEFAKYHRKQIEYDGLTFDSSWEVTVYQYCKENNIPCEYQPDITFEYEYNGKKHYYHPDFLIDGNLYEVKGGQFFDGDKMINPYDRTQDGLYEAKHQCMIKNNIIILNNISNEVINKILKGVA